MATYQQWSQSYFTNLTPDQHNANNRWFQSIRDKLTESGVLYVPILDKEFNKSGEEVWLKNISSTKLMKRLRNLSLIVKRKQQN